MANHPNRRKITVEFVRSLVWRDVELSTVRDWQMRGGDEVAKAAEKLGVLPLWKPLVEARAAWIATQYDTGRKNRIGVPVQGYDEKAQEIYFHACDKFTAAVAELWAEWLAGDGGKLARDVKGNAI